MDQAHHQPRLQLQNPAQPKSVQERQHLAPHSVCAVFNRDVSEFLNAPVLPTLVPHFLIS